MAALVPLLLLCTTVLVEGFYLPVHGPTPFCRGETKRNGSAECQSRVYVRVNELTSLKSVLPHDNHNFDCQALDYGNGETDIARNFGKIFSGYGLQSSAYNMSFMHSEINRKLCEVVYETGNESRLQSLIDKIHGDYRHSWLVDDLPVTWCYTLTDSSLPFCTAYFPVGCYITVEGVKHDACYLSEAFRDMDTTYIFNHFDIIIRYNQWGSQKEYSSIVRAEIMLQSCEAYPCDKFSKPKKLPRPSENMPANFSIVYSYSVSFLKSNISWSSRWDYILYSSTQWHTQWFSLFNSALVIAFLVFLSAFALVYHKRKEWTVKHWTVHAFFIRGNIFQPPPCPMLLAVFVGSGAQVFCTALLTLLLACVGLLCPPNRGIPEITVLVFYILTSPVAGFSSARLYKQLGGQKRIITVAFTWFFVPGAVFVTFSVLNFFLFGGVLLFWLAFCLPLMALGGCVGYRCTAAYSSLREEPEEEHIDLISHVKKEPYSKLHIFFRVPVMAFFSGLLSFSTIFIPLFFLSESIWKDKMYYTPGQLILAFLALVIVSSLISSVISLFKLQVENANWMWSSFVHSGSFAFITFVWCVVYYSRSTLTGAFLFIVYWSFCFVSILVLFMLVGSVGFYASSIYVSKLHSISQRKLAIANL